MVVRCVLLLIAGFAVSFAVKLYQYFVVVDGFEKSCSPAFSEALSPVSLGGR